MSWFGKRSTSESDTNIPKILSAVAGAGGQGIVEVPYDMFASYLRAHGEVRATSTGGQITGMLDLEGKQTKVTFDRGIFQSLTKNQTLVSVVHGIDLSLANPEQAVKKMRESIDGFIGDMDDAYFVAWQLYCLSGMLYNEAYIAKGEFKFPSQDDMAPILQRFHDKVADGDNLKTEYKNHSPNLGIPDLNERFSSLTVQVADPDRQLQINYLLIESIIKDWDLVG